MNVYWSGERLRAVAAEIATVIGLTREATMQRPQQEVEAENRALHEAISAYLSEFDNPVPDAVYRKTLRDHLRRLVGAPPQPVRGPARS
jgi:hypothetical protein